MDEANWLLTKYAPEDVVVETKIDDGDGVRNVQPLKRRGQLWWTPNDSIMYVYYTPTHWRPTASPVGATSPAALTSPPK